MSVESLSWVLQNSTAVGTDKVIMLGIANHADVRGRNAWPSVATLARYANINERAVQKALKRLVDEGHLRVQRNAGGDEDTRSDRRPNRYSITGMDTRNGVSAKTPRDTDGTSSGSPRTGRPPVHPVEADGVSSRTERGVLQDADGVSSRTPEPSLEPSLKEHAATNDDPAPVSSLETQRAAKATRQRDDLFDAVAEVCGIDVEKLPKSAGKFLGKSVAELRAVGATAGNVRYAARQWRQRFGPDITLTHTALVKHWASLGKLSGQATGTDGGFMLNGVVMAPGVRL